MGLKNELRRMLRTMERETGDVRLIWKDVSYRCTISTLRSGNTLVVGGFEETIQMTLFIRKGDMLIPLRADSTLVTADSSITIDPERMLTEPITADSTIFTADSDQITADADTPPSTGHRVTVQWTSKTRTYRVLGVREPASQSHWEFDLGSKDR